MVDLTKIKEFQKELSILKWATLDIKVKSRIQVTKSKALLHLYLFLHKHWIILKLQSMF